MQNSIGEREWRRAISFPEKEAGARKKEDDEERSNGAASMLRQLFQNEPGITFDERWVQMER